MQPRRTVISSLLALALLALGASATQAISTAVGVQLGPNGQPTVNLTFFQNNLSPYGQWVSTPAYGQVFVPSVASSWRPYTNGNWAYTDSGWTWVSNDPFGWATDHYGRWAYVDNTGWSWVPGTEWAPAYVSWQSNPQYVGWAPLPPTVGLDAGLTLGPSPFVDIAPASYTFVPVGSFMAPNIATVALPMSRSLVVFPTTQNITRYRLVGGSLFNTGLPLAVYEKAAHRRVARVQLVSLRAPARARLAGNRLALFRPRVTAPANVRTAERLARMARHDAAIRTAVHQGVQAQQRRFVVAQTPRTHNQVIAHNQAIARHQTIVHNQVIARNQVVARNHGQARAQEVHLRNAQRQTAHLATVHARNEVRHTTHVTHVTRVTHASHVQAHPARVVHTTRVVHSVKATPRPVHVAHVTHAAHPVKAAARPQAHAAKAQARGNHGHGHRGGPGF